ADGDIDADDTLALLVDDGVQRDGRLADFAVADDQLALAAADGDHAVDGLDAGLQRLLDGLACLDAGRLELNQARASRLNGALAVDGLAQRVDHSAQEAFTDGDAENLAGAFDLLALLDLQEVTHDHDTDRVFFQVERKAEHPVLE